MYLNSLPLSGFISDIQTGKVKLTEYIDIICDRIEKNEKEIKSLVPEINRRERLKTEAIKLVKKFPDKNARPPLFGVPVGVKDIFKTKGFETRAGSKLPPTCFEGAEAEVVTALKKAGALILGKTITTEFAFFQPGQTHNPHNLTHTPGGSSSGSAAAVACGFTPLALGSQTIGSIGRPASYCGVYGFKPSFSRVSTNGVVPFSVDADHVGYFCQDLKGLEITAEILCKNWKSQTINKISNPIVGIPTGKYLDQADPEMQLAMQQIESKLLKSGYSVKHVDLFEDIETINKAHRSMVAVGFARVHEKWFQKYGNLYSMHSAKLIEEGKMVSSDDYTKALLGREKLRSKLVEISHKENIGLWMSPSALGAAPEGLESTGSPLMNLPWTYSGVPVITIPLAKNSSHMPLGIQFSGAFNLDEELFCQLEIILKQFPNL